MTIKHTDRRDLGLALDRPALRRLLDVAQQFDLNQGGHYDARSGVINVWCSPEDHPACWVTPITRGGLNYPRALVGSLEWDWQGDDQVRLFVEATPYDLLGHRRQQQGLPWPLRQSLPEDEWAQLLDWLEAQARGLLRLAALAPDVQGYRCPWCDWVLPTGQMLNALLEHVQAQKHAQLTGVLLGDPPMLLTDQGRAPLETVEVF